MKTYSSSHFDVKDLGQLRYFLRIEIARSKNSLSLSQRKYHVDLLEEISMLGSNPIVTPTNPNICLDQNLGESPII